MAHLKVHPNDSTQLLEIHAVAHNKHMYECMYFGYCLLCQDTLRECNPL